MPMFHPEDLPASASVARQTAAFQEAIDDCAAGGGPLVVPSSTRLLLGTVRLRSRLHLRLEPGALLKASPNGGDFESRGSWGGWHWKYWILADDCVDLTISGSGTLDGSGVSYMERENADHFVPTGGADHLNHRPLVMGLFGCQRLRIEDIAIRDSAHWTVRTVGCRDVGISGVSILNHLKVPNNDGIDLDHCRDVRISDCHIVAGDDAISLKTVTENSGYGPMENVTVTGCTLRSKSSALVVGCENDSDVRNVIFSDCVIDGSNRGLSISLRQKGTIENVLFSNIVVRTELQGETWWGKAEPISITSLLAPLPWRDEGKLGQVRNVRFRDILCESENGVVIQGGLASRPSGISLEGVHLRLKPSREGRAVRHDFRPYLQHDLPGNHESAPPQADSFEGAPLDRGLHGFYLQRVRDVTLRNCSVELADPEKLPLLSPLTISDVENLRVEGFRG
jgi:hypothetical protein